MCEGLNCCQALINHYLLALLQQVILKRILFTCSVVAQIIMAARLHVQIGRIRLNCYSVTRRTEGAIMTSSGGYSGFYEGGLKQNITHYKTLTK